LETNASGLGAILSQWQKVNKSHTVAYATRAAPNTEGNYAITNFQDIQDSVTSMVHVPRHYRLNSS